LDSGSFDAAAAVPSGFFWGDLMWWRQLSWISGDLRRRWLYALDSGSFGYYLAPLDFSDKFNGLW
jgi:hypothetical protein